jgi:pyruvate/2-oxoglutarate dehydrogenase complex dihydrolipoamide acyltransferase (E2) component
MRQIFWIIIIVCVVIFGVVWYVNRSKTHAVNSGQVFVRGQQGDKGKTDAAAPAASSENSTDQPAETPAAAPAAGTDAAPAEASAPAQSGAGAAQSGAVTPPATDSISRNPPNGMVFSGTGKFQLYRQGDITWRLNTETGQACILFATNAEWRQMRVYQHGCGGS